MIFGQDVRHEQPLVVGMQLSTVIVKSLVLGHVADAGYVADPRQHQCAEEMKQHVHTACRDVEGRRGKY
jgi:hypothetical protein